MKFASTKQRIIQFIDYKMIDRKTFFVETAIKRGFLDGDKLDAAVSDDIIAKIIAKYPELNVLWLITGEGDMLNIIGNTNEPSIVSEPQQLLVKTPFSKRVKKPIPEVGLIKFYDIDFAAGDIEFYENDAALKPAYTMDIPEFHGCTAFRTYNNSMEKLIYSGDILFGTKEEGWQDGLEYGQIYGIVCHNNRRYLKYIRKAADKHDTHFLLRSENDEYDDFLLAKDKVKSLWLIHGWLKKRV